MARTPLKATFFALNRREPGGVILRATFVHFVLALALAVIVAAGVGVLAVGAGVVPNIGPSDISVSDVGVAFWGGALLLVLVLGPVAASYEAACLRWMIRGETVGFGGFSLGGDTWRVYAGYWIWFAVSCGVWIGVMALMIGALAFLYGGQGEREWVGYAVIAMWALILTPFALRMSTGNAASIAKRKFAYFDAWTVSRDRSLALLGSYSILWALWLVVWIVVFLGLSVVIFMALGQRSEMSPVTSFFMISGFMLAIGFANWLLALLSTGVNARAVLAAVEDGKLHGAGISAATIESVFA